MIEYAWLIPVFPFAAFVLIFFAFRFWKGFSGYVAVAGILASFLLALPVFGEALAGKTIERTINWLPLAGGNHALEIGFMVDPLTAIMLVVVTTVSLLVIFYSQGYMHGDGGYSRYFAFISLFCMSMLGLVLANNLLVVYMFWEGVGLGSYLLIGFWFQKRAVREKRQTIVKDSRVEYAEGPEMSPAIASKKAFIVTRFGDFGFLVGILLLFSQAGTLEFSKIEEMIAHNQFSPEFMSLVGILIFCGAVGKSAQFPLHVWLPDAMEGPTPVSALIHAATMVAAGVYLVARTFPIFEAGPAAMTTVMVIGTITAILAASMGLVANDIKRVMAFSTVSQLGYMMLALGVGARGPAIFHLFNHAFFKALLFLTAGSVIHAMHNAFPREEDEWKRQDVRFLGGLGKYMPVTKWAMLIAGLSLAGFPLISGFWSKDEILAMAFERNQIVFWIGLFTAFLTAFYMFRAWFLTFTGEPRWLTASGGSGDGETGGHDSHQSSHDGHDHHGPSLPHESPWVMAAPLVILMVPSLLSGFWGSPFWPGLNVGSFLEGKHEAVEVNGIVMALSIVAGLGGIALAWVMYYRRSLSPEKVAGWFGPMYTVLINKWWIDEFYNGVIVKYLVLGTARLMLLFDTYVVDATVNGVGSATRSAGGLLRQVQTGKLQNYGWAMYAGALVIALAAILGR
ncbi:MAG TPA: NADH-quinone oxidoreductase subunit L [Chloroflexota bacterium]